MCSSALLKISFNKFDKGRKSKLQHKREKNRWRKWWRNSCLVIGTYASTLEQVLWFVFYKHCKYYTKHNRFDVHFLLLERNTVLFDKQMNNVECCKFSATKFPSFVSVWVHSKTHLSNNRSQKRQYYQNWTHNTNNLSSIFFLIKLL